MESHKTKVLGVQYLRAIAALMVAYFHLSAQIPAYAGRVNFLHLFSTDRLPTGVPIFFVISGFIMMATTRNSAPAVFLLRRIIRIVPLYWFFTIALVVLKAIPPHFFAKTPVTPTYFVKSLMFFSYVNPRGDLGPLLGPGWTLNVEMFFYVAFAAALFLPFGRRVLAVAIGFVGLVLAGMLLPAPSYAPELWIITRPWLFEFLLGMTIAHVAVTRAWRLNRFTCAGLVLGGFAVLLHGGVGWTATDAARILSASAIVLGTVAYEQRYGMPELRLPMLLGDASYSIYLSHLFTLGAFDVLWNRVAGDQKGWFWQTAFGIASIAMVIVVAVAVYKTVELPMLRILHRWQKGRMTQFGTS
jgi:exopolysaccharide production protein ExoZ